jgi:NhaA family Na+:H+ antiporter
MAAARGAVFANAASLPNNVSWGALRGCAWLGGMGFTMSLFIATLAFDGTPLLNSAKVGILVGSVAAGLLGAVVVRVSVAS